MSHLQNTALRVYRCASTCKRFISSHAITCRDEADCKNIAFLIDSQRQLEDELTRGHSLTTNLVFPLVIRALEASEHFIAALQAKRIECSEKTSGGEL